MDIEIAIEPKPHLNQNSELISHPLDSEIISIMNMMIIARLMTELQTQGIILYS
jgi:hypothetical protein